MRTSRAPRKLRRETRRRVDAARVRRAPTLSVVMPAYNTRAFIAAALESVLTQSLTDLEVVVVDDGSTDGSGDIASSIAARDPRVRVVRQANAGLGAARNVGAEHARGAFLAFCDSDDLVLPGAYEAMVGRLQHTGSEFVTGAIVRGPDEASAVRPGWVSRHLDRDRDCLRIQDHPWMLLDITAPNKVFRRAFWRAEGLRFPVGVRYEDQVPMVTALMHADCFDIVRRPVYLWRSRMDGTSISQQKADPLDLRDRIRSQDEAASLFDGAPKDLKEVWYLKLLDFDMPAYLTAALSSGQPYVEALSRQLEKIRREAPAHTWQEVSFPSRSLAWVLSHGGRDAGTTLRVWQQRNPHGLPVTVVGGEARYDVPDEVTTAELPTHLRVVRDVDVRPVVRLTEVVWRGTQLVLRGSAMLTPLDTSYAPHRLDLVLHGPQGFQAPVTVTRHTDPRLDELALRSHEDRSDSGFEAVVDAAHLARALPPGQHSLDLEFRHRQGSFERTSPITHVLATESGGDRSPRCAEGRMVRLAGFVGGGFRVLVHDTYAVLEGSTSAPDDALELTLRVPAGDPVVLVELVDPETGVPHTELDHGTPAPDELHVVVRAAEAPLVLRTLHRSGRRTRVLWGGGPNALGAADRGAFVHRGAAQLVTVDTWAPTVVVSSVGFDGADAVLSGTSLGAAGRRLHFSGPRAHGDRSEPLPAGDFRVRVPLEADPWGSGARALPEGPYELASAGPDGAPTTEDAAPRHLTTSELRAELPPEHAAPGQRVRAGVGNDWNLVLRSNALAAPVAASREQQRLREEAYAAARVAERAPVVLLESFGGKSTGDSPAAVATELLRRGSDLDLVWSVVDGSVPVPEGTRAVHRFTPEWYDLLGRAAYLVNNNNFPHFFRAAEGQTYLQAWHGTPLKRIGNDITDRRYLTLSYLRTMDEEARAWDALVSPSPYCSEIFPRAFGYSGRVLETGYPRNDILVRPEGAERAAEVRALLGIDPDQHVVLYAPTWRDSVPSDSGHAKVLHLDPDRLAAQLPGSVVLVRGHSNSASAPSIHGSRDSRVLDVTLYPDVNDLFLVSDALVTDYSSVMFDFAVLDRPLLFLVPDLVHYRDAIRGFYFDFEAEAPGPLCSTEEELLVKLAALPAEDPRYRERRARFRERFAPLDDGHAAARVVDAVFGPAAH
ncbi:hypothetical protein ASG49_00930 [Marmoricola sp. Leaf446]|uniref:bifunctional glycosyltransferase/CDP-glycerol:glycerophosphate glycerophosphotransferase n=1 Tax=Marmoricola sp. Leaf446 TaxID=1736379 RepID=UPI0006FFFC76|nr:bifunctional glycosyltransferase family 2 protein/CDP-glycerol:glycerophosphate glycerophosphotransferase [Marmoricola sp. Leaf446]KQT93600.1 hypothetical protein ASG49_00930 [Marmoricola sp. Leaf446]